MRSGAKRRCQPSSGHHARARSMSARSSSPSRSPQYRTSSASSRCSRASSGVVISCSATRRARAAASKSLRAARERTVSSDAPTPAPASCARWAKSLAQLGVAGPDRRAARAEQERHGDRLPGVEEPAGDAQGVLGSAVGSGLQHGGEADADVASAQDGERCGHGFAVEGVDQGDVAVGDRGVHDDPAAGLELRQWLGVGEADELVEAQRLAEGEQLQDAALGVGQLGEALGHQLSQCPRHPGTVAHAPDAADGPQRAVRESTRDELADVQRVPLAGVVDPALHAPLHRALDHGLDQPAGGRLVEPAELEAGCARVLPERDDRVGARLAGADGGEDERGPGRGEVQHEGGGRGVEQLGVVDAQDEPVAARELAERFDAAAHELEAVVGTDVGGHEARERAERDGRGAAGRLHPRRLRAIRGRGGQGLACEARLAHAGAGEDHHAGGAIGAQPRDALELGLAPDQRRPHP